MKKKQALKRLSLQKIKIISLSTSRVKNQAEAQESTGWTCSEVSKDSMCPECHYFPPTDRNR